MQCRLKSSIQIEREKKMQDRTYSLTKQGIFYIDVTTYNDTNKAKNVQKNERTT